jgi:hypothetical protein
MAPNLILLWSILKIRVAHIICQLVCQRWQAWLQIRVLRRIPYSDSL